MTLVRCLMPNSRAPLRTDTAPQSSFKILNFSLISTRKKKEMRWPQFFIRLILFLKKKGEKKFFFLLRNANMATFNTQEHALQ